MTFAPTFLARTVCLTIFTLCPLGMASEVLSSKWGNIKGRIVIETNMPDRERPPRDFRLKIAEGGGVSYVVVQIADKVQNIHPEYARKLRVPVQIDVSGPILSSRIYVVQPGQAVRLTNRMDDEALLTMTPIASKFDSIFQIAPGQTTQFIFDKPEPRAIDLNFEDLTEEQARMGLRRSAHFVVPIHPYAAVTNSEGEFELSNVPQGKYQVIIWHELLKYGAVEPMSVSVKGDSTTNLGTIKVDSSKFHLLKR